ncbi:MAG: SMI1/KNR4 family protein [Acidobacteriota bacterium]
MINKVRQARLRSKQKLARAEVEQFESEAGVLLPQDYRDYLFEVGNPGRGIPLRKLVPLTYWHASYWIEEPKPSMVAEPCIVTPEAEQHGEHWIDRANVADWEARWDNGEWDPMFGTIALSEIGCGLFYSMIITGPFRGRVFHWGDHALNPPVVYPEASFGEWFDKHVKASIAPHQQHRVRRWR